MPSQVSSRTANGIDKLDFDDNRHPSSAPNESDPAGLLRDDESLLSNVVDGVIERDRQRLRHRAVKYLSFVSAILSWSVLSSVLP